MDKKISELVELEELRGDEFIVVQQTTDNFKVALSKVNPIGVRNANGGTSVNDINNSAAGDDSFVANLNNEARGNYSSAFGESNTTDDTAVNSFVCGENNITKNVAEFACGRWNVSHTGSKEAENTLYSVGFGSGGTKQVNAVEVMGDGSYYLVGVGGYNGNNPGAEGVKTLQDVVNNTFDASELYLAARANGTITPEFRASLEEAIAAKKLCYIISDNTLIMITFAGSDGNGGHVFITSNGTTKYQMSVNKDNLAKLEVGLVGNPIRRYIADEGRSLLDLNESSDITAIREALITTDEEVMIPEAGDIIQVRDSEGIMDCGIVISKTTTSSSINYIVRGSNLVDGMSIEYHIKFNYNDSVGIDSLRIAYADKTTIDPKLISEESMIAMYGRMSSVESHQSVFNISQINEKQYNDLQSAISALNTFLGDKPKYPGMMITFVLNNGTPEAHMFTGGSFVDTRSWTRFFPFSIFN